MGDEPPGPQECTRTPSTSAPRAPANSCEVASGTGPSPASARASAISWAVRNAVPLGASIFCGWCSSMISTDSKCRAARAANSIISTAPIAKLGAMTTPTPGLSASQPGPFPAVGGEAGRADDHVETVVDAPPQVVHHDVGGGEVDHHLGPRGGVRQLVAVVDRRDQLQILTASTAWHASVPIRPRAPSTPTLIVFAHAGQTIPNVGFYVWNKKFVKKKYTPFDQLSSKASRAAASAKCLVVELADHRERHRAGQQLPRHLTRPLGR